MPDTDNPLPQVPESKVVEKKRARLSLVWVIPIVAAVAGLWITVTRILNQGPEITIVFQSAEGLEASKTKINYNGLDAGVITALRLSADHKHVVATARMDPRSEHFLVKDTKFWVVRPQISGLNITGLGTLISGNYIGIQLGKSQERERRFVALDEPPITGDVAGRMFKLKAPNLGSLDKGTPVYFRRLTAGKVVSYELEKDGQSLTVQIFVQAPYDQYVTADTRFWQASGIEMSLSAGGLHVQTESLMSILAGGIAFATPATGQTLPPSAAESVFTLFSDRTEAFRPPAHDPQTYLLIFKQSVRGLAAGAPVEMKGIQIGEVTDVRAQFDAKTDEFSVPVTIHMDPARFGVKLIDMPADGDVLSAHKKVMDNLVARGLRAQLRSGSLISGSLYVAIDLFPEAPPATLDWSQTPVQLPTQPGQIEAIEASVASFVKKLDQLNLNELIDTLRKTIGELDKTLVSVRGTFTNTDRLLNTADKLIAPNSTLVSGVDGTLQEASGAARSLRVLLDYLERHPESLLRGKTGEAK